MRLHKSGKVVANGPSAPPSPNEELMLSKEVDSYLTAVSEASSGQGPLLCGDLAQSILTTSSGFKTGRRVARATKGVPRAEGTPRVSTGVVDVATDLAVVSADEAAPAAMAEDPPSLTPASITINGNG